MPLDPFSYPPQAVEGFFSDRIKIGISLALKLHAEGLIEEAKHVFEQVRRDARTHPGFAVLLSPDEGVGDLAELEGLALTLEERFHSISDLDCLSTPIGDNDN